MRSLYAAIILAASVTTASATVDGDAMDLGELLGRADACGIEIPADKLVQFTTSKDLLDTRPMSLMEQARRVTTKRYEASEANCAVTRASLEHNGLI